MGARKFSGNLRMATVNASAVLTGPYIGLLNSIKCEIAVPAADNLDQVSNEIASFGQLLDRKQVAKAPSFSVTVDDMTDARIFAYALNGTVQSYSQSATTVASEVTASPAKPLDWVPLAHGNIGSFVLKSSDDATTYDAGVDYSVDLSVGMWTTLPGGAIAASTNVHANYNVLAVSGSTILGSTVPSNLLRVVVDLQDIGDGSRSMFICPKFQAAAAGNQDLMAKNLLNAPLTGGMLLPPFGTAAYTETSGAAYIFRNLN